MVHMYWKVSLGIVVVHAPFPGERKLSSSVVDCHDIDYEDGCLLLMGKKIPVSFWLQSSNTSSNIHKSKIFQTPGRVARENDAK